MPQDQDKTTLARFEEALTLSALSSSTIVNYLADLRAFLRWGEEEIGNNFSVRTVTQEHLRGYRHYLAYDLNRAASTINRHLMALRKFFAFAREMTIVATDPTTGIGLVQENKQVKSRFLSDQEVHKLLEAARNGTRAGLVRRDLAILHLLLDTGLSVSEIINLSKDDLSFDNPGVSLKVGGDQDGIEVRILPLSSPVCKVLFDYLMVRPRTTTADNLFLSQDGRAISSRTVQRVISDCAKSCGLERVSAQSMRRTFAMNLYSSTKNLELVSKRLGHQNKSITEQYLALKNDR
jgi:integrase/recombinase XerC